MNLKKFPPISINFHKYLLISIGTLIIVLYSLFVFHNSARADITTGLVGWWKFDEGSGTTAADSSGNNNNGSLTNGPTWTTGQIGGALNFDGVDDRVLLASDPISINTITVCAWIYPRQLNAIKGIVNNVRFGFNIYPVSNKLQLISNSTSGSGIQSADNSLSINIWQHVCAVRLNDGTGTLYVNGTQSGSSGNTNIPVSGFGLAIGAAGNTGSYPFDGLIDDVRIYNRALSATEIQELYNYTGGTPTPTPSVTPTPTPSGTPTPSASVTPTPSPSPTPDATPPVRSNGSPSGSLPAGTTQTTLSLSTNENATCKYSTIANTTYSSISNTFSTTGGTSHSSTITGLSNGVTYNYYIRCQDTSNNANPDDYTITFSVASQGAGNIINAASNSQVDVQAAVNLANAGDTINVPAGTGTVTWSAPVTINKAVKVVGPGAASLSVSWTGSSAMSISGAVEVSGFKFVTNTAQTAIMVTGGNNWRIHHCEYVNTQAFNRGLFVWGGFAVVVKGLVDNCTIFDGMVFSGGAESGNWSQNAAAWRTPLDLGGDSAVYVEDCTFTLTSDWAANAMDGNRGSRFVFRYNTLNHLYIEAHSCYQGGSLRGTRKWEIYGNTLNNTGTRWSGNAINAGTGVIFANDYTSVVPFAQEIRFQNTRSEQGDVNDNNSHAGRCDGNSTFDMNDDATGWPCRDQIGRSTDVADWPVETNPGPDQESVPAYVWSVWKSGVRATLNTNDPTHIQADRDYFVQGSSFDGSSGVGCGTLAQRDAIDKPGNGICTDGVGFWVYAPGQDAICSNNISAYVGANHTANISGTLYKCVSNTWVADYTPYTYPHPLRNVGSPDTTPPAAPSGVTVN